jgi:hypothetical protein
VRSPSAVHCFELLHPLVFPRLRVIEKYWPDIPRRTTIAPLVHSPMLDAGLAALLIEVHPRLRKLAVHGVE